MAEIAPQELDRVLDFLPLFQDSTQEFYRIESESPTLDPYRYSEEVRRFVTALHAAGLIVPFDWPAWQGEARCYVENPHLLDSADLATLQKLLTTHVRADRFNSGHLAAMIDCGHILAILERLEIIRSAG